MAWQCLPKVGGLKCKKVESSIQFVIQAKLTWEPTNRSYFSRISSLVRCPSPSTSDSNTKCWEIKWNVCIKIKCECDDWQWISPWPLLRCGQSLVEWSMPTKRVLVELRTATLMNLWRSFIRVCTSNIPSIPWPPPSPSSHCHQCLWTGWIAPARLPPSQALMVKVEQSTNKLISIIMVI